MKNRLIVDIYWCALSATWCCKTLTIIYAQNIVVQKILSELRRMRPHPPHPPGSATPFGAYYIKVVKDTPILSATEM